MLAVRRMAITSYGSIGSEVRDGEASDVEAASEVNRGRVRVQTPLIRRHYNNSPPRNFRDSSFWARHRYSTGNQLIDSY